MCKLWGLYALHRKHLACAWHIANTQCVTRQCNSFYLTLIISHSKSSLPLNRHQNPKVMIHILQFLQEHGSDLPILERRWCYAGSFCFKKWCRSRWHLSFWVALEFLFQGGWSEKRRVGSHEGPGISIPNLWWWKEHWAFEDLWSW